jgi:hypothetical protein
VEPHPENLIVAFSGHKLIARGTPREVALKTKAVFDGKSPATILLFDDRTSEPVEMDFRGTVDDVAGRLPAEAPVISAETTAGDTGTARFPGRPKLGVVGREVTLLPRHWAWLATQPGGASVTLRRLVEAAKRVGAEDDRRREARDASYRFMNAMAGDEPGFEEACRALFAGDSDLFDALVSTWPSDVRDHALELAGRSFEVRGTGA